MVIAGVHAAHQASVCSSNLSEGDEAQCSFDKLFARARKDKPFLTSLVLDLSRQKISARYFFPWREKGA
jgi:hypothetical protein